MTPSSLPAWILCGTHLASQVSQAILNRGKPSRVIMHPRRWYWMASSVASTWPMIQQADLDPQSMGLANANGYGKGVSRILPAGLNVVLDANVQAVALGTAQTGGTQDVVYVVPASECLLFEAPSHEVFIRAEAPAANQLGVMLVATNTSPTPTGESQLPLSRRSTELARLPRLASDRLKIS